MPHITIALADEPESEVQSLEYAWLGDLERSTTIVFLHEGLGSLSAWGSFPERLCRSLNLRGLVYSRAGYGVSVTNRPRSGLAVDYHDREALQVLPGLLDALGIQSCYLFGHSDGATIALLAAAMVNTRKYQGVVLLAPHIFVEAVTLRGLHDARSVYEIGDLKDKISRHHLDVDSVFYGWNDVWLSSAFRDWNIEERLSAIQCPVLAIQGIDDEYATLEQLRGIERQIKHAQILEIPDCRHFPHREAESEVTRATKNFIADTMASDEGWLQY